MLLQYQSSIFFYTQDTSGGYGLCMDKDAAQTASKSDWFDCKMPGLKEEKEDTVISDPYDPSCLLVTLQGDESTCKGTTGSDGLSCEWCNVAGNSLCVNFDQSQIVTQIGGSCDSTSDDLEGDDGEQDPYDPSCIAITMGGDESSCKATKDADGAACEWCSIGTTELCLNGDQAQILEQVGGSCNEKEMLTESLFF
jgi:hypothetical protein